MSEFAQRVRRKHRIHRFKENWAVHRVIILRMGEEGRIIGRKIVRYEQVQSTNDLLREWADRAEPEGLVITAEEQLAGRGRMGRKWVVPPGTSLQLSILLRPPLAPLYAQRITQMAALAVARTLEQEFGLRPMLKWPNDVLLGEQNCTREAAGMWRKCAGILTETSVRGEMLEYAILGIGLNVNYTMRVYPELAQSATTLQDAVGREIDRAALERVLLGTLDSYYARLKHGEDLLPEYRSKLNMLGQVVRVATSNGVLEGIAQDVDGDGALVLYDGMKLKKLYAGDVTVLKQTPFDSGDVTP